MPINHYYLVDFATSKVVRSGSAGVTNAIYCDFSPDGRHVTVAGHDGQVAVIDLATGKPVRPAVDAYSGDTFSVRYNAEGTLVTTASTTGQLALLNGKTGQLLATSALPPPGSVSMSNFAPDGSVLVVTFDGDVFRWDPSAGNALDFACSITGRGLAPNEWADVFPGRPWRQTCPN